MLICTHNLKTMHAETKYTQRSYIQQLSCGNLAGLYIPSKLKKMFEKLQFCIQFCSHFNAITWLLQYIKKLYAKSEKISKDCTDIARKLRLSSLHINIRDAACMKEVIRLCSSSRDKHWLDIQDCPWLLPILLQPPNLPSLENVIKDHLGDYSRMLRPK